MPDLNFPVRMNGFTLILSQPFIVTKITFSPFPTKLSGFVSGSPSLIRNSSMPPKALGVFFSPCTINKSCGLLPNCFI